MRDRPNEKHRAVAANAVGRQLGPEEVVHHENEDKADNSPANLSVEPRAAHTAAHNRARNLSKLRSALRAFKEGRKLY